MAESNHLNAWLLGELLHLANSDPPYWRTEFYQIKDRILMLYGTWEGVHLQHVVKYCYLCNGTGKITTEEMVLGQPMRISGGRKCFHCNDGIYQQFWTVLKYYRLGDRHFHIPNGMRYSTRESVPQLEFDQEIEGYVRHERPRFYLGDEAAYWLALIFAPNLFWRRFGHIGHVSRKFMPMVILGTWLFNLRQLRYLRSRTIEKFNRLSRRFRNWKRANCFHDFGESERIGDDHIWDRCTWCGIERGEAIGYFDVLF